jgi:predicted amidohydrolase YtcJ
VPRFAELGVVASVQPVHCVSDGPWVPQRLGEDRAGETSYVWRDLLDSGARLASGTDAPVEDVNPLATFRAAVTRDMGVRGAFFAEQAMTRQEALRSMTLDAAWAVFEEHEKGSLEVGKLADLTVLSGNILELDEAALNEVVVNQVVVGGTVRYRRSR